MKPTIKDVAEGANVSIATVSHVINKTRYVSQDLIDRVEAAIKEVGYERKGYSKLSNGYEMKFIGLLIPDISSKFYADIANVLEEELRKRNYYLIIYCYGKDKDRELKYLTSLIFKDKVQGTIIIPYDLNPLDLKLLIDSKIPYVFIDNYIEGLRANTVLSNNKNSAYDATSHLIKYGHESIGLLLSDEGGVIIDEHFKSYNRALEDYNIEFDQNLIIYANNEIESANIFRKFLITEKKVTAVICTTTMLTISVFRFLSTHHLKCPQDMSVIGWDDFGMGDLFDPPLTSISQSPEGIAKNVVEILLKILNDSKSEIYFKRVPVMLNIRNSTQIIGRGPNGEKAEHPETLVLSESETQEILKRSYSAAIAFHYSGKAWMKLIENGIRDIFYKLGIKIIAITDAHFDAHLQSRQLESLLSQKPDIIISIPCDEIITAPSYKKIAESDTKLILIDNMPVGLKHNDYVTCVSVNERENGYNAGKLLGMNFRNFDDVKVGLIVHGAPFFTTKQRDSAAEQALLDEFNNIQIIAKESFIKEERVYGVCRNMIKLNPEIKGIYVSWDGPALKVINALSDMGREDIAIVTCDLDIDVALDMAKRRMIKGISAQLPYEEGVAMAYAAGNAWIGKRISKYIGVKPYIVTLDNLLQAWTDIIKEKPPEKLTSLLKNII